MPKDTYHARLNGIAQVAMGAILLCVPAIYAGRPQPFSDSKAYYALGQATASAITGHLRDANGVGASLRSKVPPSDSVHRGQDRATSVRLAYTVAASRSPYWSVLFYLAATIGTAWLMVAAQALIAALVIWIALRAFGVDRVYLPIVAVLTLASSLPVEVMFLMPDLFAGLVILAAAVIAFRLEVIRRWERACLWMVMAGGALFHTSHLLVLATLGLSLMLLELAGRRGSISSADTSGVARGSTGLVLLAAAVGCIGAIGYPIAVQATLHERLYAPPFLAARLIADGPGRAVLAQDCASGDVWGWCRLAGRPMTDANVILWSTKPTTASFQAADYDQRVRIIQEQQRFVARVVSAYPGQVVGTLAANVARLFFEYGTRESLDDRTTLFRDPDFAVLTRIIPGSGHCASRGDCRLAINIPALDRRIGLTLLASWIGIGIFIFKGGQHRRWIGFLTFVIAGLCLNAIICGGLSGDAQRYQSRVTWLVPLMAMILLADCLQAKQIAGRESKQGSPDGVGHHSVSAGLGDDRQTAGVDLGQP